LLKTRPAIGTVLNHGDYDSFKSSLTRVALRKGYFDSEFNKSQLGVSLDRHQAFWDIDYDSGERYRFGRSLLKARKFATNICKTWCRLKRATTTPRRIWPN
jgi:outer membrane translocation and assembly module TamA